uniref:Peptidase M24 domain-containing protein n=1 Tax=Fibrocapsa japonica TaxID=94617 RepID=A0A7S2UWR2_9STRA|mmetsp:Transcript_17587/g.25679  ORF Transcript_17587/g.25679 Transcript_17587/m.25679 type:complete len:420 (+) Transcript_17587:125-1384(+)
MEGELKDKPIKNDESEEEESEEEDEEKEDEVTDLSNSDVTTKYREAAKIVDLALQGVLTQCTPGARIIDICKFGDSVINQRVGQIFRNKVKGQAIEKGVAFPTCVSVNECLCHNSPLESEEQEPLKAGDVVKIDLGCHIDGYIAVAAHTAIVGAAGDGEATGAAVPGSVGGPPAEGPLANVVLAAHTAGEVALKTLKPGNTNQMVTDAIAKVAEAYNVQCVSGTLMHQMKRYVIDGNKVIILRQDVEQRVEECTFEPYEVYAIDIAMSTGEGKPRETDTRTTVFKRAVDKNYRLKMRASRYLFNEVNTRYPTLPFTLRAFDDERQARMGVVECLKHELLHPYPVLFERQGEHVAHFKFTVLLLPSGQAKVTGLPLPEGAFTSDCTVDEETAALLATSSKKKRKKKKKKAASAEGDKEET